jgi:hypothetical protein
MPMPECKSKFHRYVEMSYHSRITESRLSPVAGDEEGMIMSKSTSHCGITIAIGAKETPLSHSVKPKVVAVHHHAYTYMWRKFRSKRTQPSQPTPRTNAPYNSTGIHAQRSACYNWAGLGAVRESN